MTEMPAEGVDDAGIAVSPASPEQAAAAGELAAALGLPRAVFAAPGFDYFLVVTADRLELRTAGPHAPGPVFVDFVGGAVGHRHRFGGGRGQPLARAVGLKAGAIPTVLDATAGLGRDAFVLADLGCSVRLVERSPVIAALLRDGLRRAAAEPELAPIVDRMTLIEGDAKTYLATLADTDRPDVVYLDPMYPHRTKSALVKKEMRVFRAVVGEDPDAPGLLAAALTCARRRVVVKRPRLAPSLEGPKPTTVIEGKTTRFDVYSVLAGRG